MKLNELLGKDYVPGSMKVTRKSWLPGSYFIPYFQCRDGLWYGLEQHNGPLDVGLELQDWKEYKEPLHSIDELVAQQTDFIPGKLKLVEDNGHIFYPYFKDDCDCWIGHLICKTFSSRDCTRKFWRIAND